MSVEAFWSVTFTTALGRGAGIVIMEQGKLRGGDHRCYYLGTYGVSGRDFSAQLQIVKYDSDSSPHLFGLMDVFEIAITGELTGGLIQATGVDTGNPSRRVGIICKHIVDLPEYAAA
jgi:hypothetical protein